METSKREELLKNKEELEKKRAELDRQLMVLDEIEHQRFVEISDGIENKYPDLNEEYIEVYRRDYFEEDGVEKIKATITVELPFIFFIKDDKVVSEIAEDVNDGMLIEDAKEDIIENLIKTKEFKEKIKSISAKLLEKKKKLDKKMAEICKEYCITEDVLHSILEDY